MLIRIALHDGTKAMLQEIVQTSNYRGGYLKMPDDPVKELEAIATRYIPVTWPPRDRRVKVVVPDDRRMREIFERDREKWMKTLPAVLSVGVFWSCREPEGVGKHTFLTLAWLQDDMAPHISDENRGAMKKVEWDQEVGFTGVE